MSVAGSSRGQEEEVPTPQQRPSALGKPSLAVGGGEEAVTLRQQDTVCLSPAPAKAQPALTRAHSINREVLGSGVLCLPGEWARRPASSGPKATHVTA